MFEVIGRAPSQFGREKILAAAEHLFVTNGYRGATMEGLAELAGMSKATVYAYFGDKDAAFTGVAERLADRLDSAVREALGRNNPVPERIADALIAKQKIVFEVVRSSPFAPELFAASGRVVANIFDLLDDDIEQMLAVALSDDLKNDDAVACARLLFGAAQGIADRSKNLETAVADIRILVSALLKTPK